MLSSSSSENLHSLKYDRMLSNFALILPYMTIAIDYYPTKCMKYNKKTPYQNIKRRNFKSDSKVFKLIPCK